VRKFVKAIPFLGWSPKKIITVFVMIGIVVAVIWRVSPLRKIVTGS